MRDNPRPRAITPRRAARTTDSRTACAWPAPHAVNGSIPKHRVQMCTHSFAVPGRASALAVLQYHSQRHAGPRVCGGSGRCPAQLTPRAARQGTSKPAPRRNPVRRQVPLADRSAPPARVVVKTQRSTLTVSVTPTPKCPVCTHSPSARACSSSPSGLQNAFAVQKASLSVHGRTAPHRVATWKRLGGFSIMMVESPRLQWIGTLSCAARPWRTSP